MWQWSIHSPGLVMSARMSTVDPTGTDGRVLPHQIPIRHSVYRQYQVTLSVQADRVVHRMERLGVVEDPDLDDVTDLELPVDGPCSRCRCRGHARSIRSARRSTGQFIIGMASFHSSGGAYSPASARGHAAIHLKPYFRQGSFSYGPWPASVVHHAAARHARASRSGPARRPPAHPTPRARRSRGTCSSRRGRTPLRSSPSTPSRVTSSRFSDAAHAVYTPRRGALIRSIDSERS